MDFDRDDSDERVSATERVYWLQGVACPASLAVQDMQSDLRSYNRIPFQQPNLDLHVNILQAGWPFVSGQGQLPLYLRRLIQTGGTKSKLVELRWMLRSTPQLPQQRALRWRNMERLLCMQDMAKQAVWRCRSRSC